MTPRSMLAGLLLAACVPTLAAANPTPLPSRLPKDWKGGDTSRYVWNIRLDVPTWVIDCEKSAPDCQEKAPLYWLPDAGNWTNFLGYQSTTRPGLAAPSGLPKANLPSGRVELTVTLAASRLMASQGMSLKGLVLQTATQDINLNSDGKTRSARLEADSNNNAALLITAVNEDGSTERVRLLGGTATPLR